MGELTVDDSWLYQLSQLPTNDQVGEYSLPKRVTATHIDGSENLSDGLRFGDEIPLELRVEPRQIRDWKRFRLEFKSEDAHVRGHWVVIAWKPDSLQCYQPAQFKGPYRKGPDRLSNTLPSSIQSATLVALPFDPTETGTSNTAALNEPVGFFNTDRPGRRLRTQGFHIGLTLDYAEAKSRLQESIEVLELWRLTETRALRFAPSAVRSTKPIRVYEEIIPDCFAILMEMSISQALAGPGNEQGWRARKVTDLVERIYKGHVSNLNRRTWKRRRAEGQSD